MSNLNVKEMELFFKLLQENRERLAEMLHSDDSDSETASVRSIALKSTPKQNVASAKKPDDMSKDLMKELECPVCMDFMSPPIMMCYNGHNICSNCRPKLKRCPTCKKSFLKVRNRALEKLVQNIESPCHFAEYGCTKSFPPGILEKHENLCIYHPYICPLFDAECIECKWNGAYCGLKDHIESEHKDRLTVVMDERKVVMKKFIPTRKYSRIIFACGEIFYQQFQVINDMFYFAIQHVGPEMCAQKFRYTFALTVDKNIEAIFIAFIARSYKVNIDDVYRSGQCVKLHYDTVKNFMEGNETLEFHFNVTPANSRKQTE